MIPSPAQIRETLQAFDFEKLFVEQLGWDRAVGARAITIDEETLSLKPIAQKRGMVTFVCSPETESALPPHTLRKKIERQVSKETHEHLIIFCDRECTTQVWQWVRREPGKPIACREIPFKIGQAGDALIQKLQAIAFGLEEEETLTIIDVTGRVRASFDVEKVTKKFYERFQKEHTAFLAFIEGIDQDADREWYASVMLNRLMFCYFIQKKGFLDNDMDYLRARLGMVQAECGADQFHSFYRQFLLRLFHEGLGGCEHNHDLEKLLGRIPYLNGGLFDIHELERPERYGAAIQIPDEAFAQIFDYFDQYQWHLDDRPLQDQNEINPDVLGYIFEKYINQKQMGAFYTKEDITEYISKNTVLPCLFDSARSRCKIAFDNPGHPTIWNLLRDDPDRYIYEAIRHGTNRPLPDEIAVGVNPPTLHDPVGEGPVATLEARREWNKPAPPECALPTEIWREVVVRRQRYEEIRAKLSAGEICDINDLITLNLDIRQFAQDVVETCEGPDLLRAFWKSIESVTILDPTCGSGAFLFAALNILEPLYEACLDRMEAFIEDLERSGEKHRPEKYSDFRKILERVNAHPNRKYFVYKSIILNNLYGVDIMDEAIEICKLRLFLKLAAQVEPDLSHANLGIEPLPDIDFNIRAGNTLVGYSTWGDVEKALTSRLDLDNTVESIKTAAADLQQAFDAFRARQIEGHGSVPLEHKQELRERLRILGQTLDRQLAIAYGNDPAKASEHQDWLTSHRPFHWLVEFYGIMKRGGFSAVVGNPPYVEYSKIKKHYQPKGLKTIGSGNLYGMVVEISLALLGQDSRLGLILPMSLVATPRMEAVRTALMGSSACTHLSHYSGNRNPSVLFEGVEMRLTICLAKTRSGRGDDERLEVFSTGFQRWASAARGTLFEIVSYTPIPRSFIGKRRLPKPRSELELAVLAKLAHSSARKGLGASQVEGGKHNVYAHRIASYFVKALTFVPHFRSDRDGKKRSEDYKVFPFSHEDHALSVCCTINSSLFYTYYILWSDAYHCGRDLVEGFPVDIDSLCKELGQELRMLERELMADLVRNSEIRRIRYRTTGNVEMQKFFPKLSKPILDRIDVSLARYYRFTEEELDTLLSHDIQYRIGCSRDGS